MKQGIAMALIGTVLMALTAQAAPQGVVNVNTADIEELRLLPTVGQSIAQRIVAYRSQHGPFETVEDLLAVKGIGAKTLERLRPHVALRGKTTLAEKVRSPRKKGR